MNRSTPVDGFSLAYTDRPADPSTTREASVVLLHGWPGDSSDYREVLPLLDPSVRVVVPDLRGFGDSDRPPLDPDTNYGATAQARSVAGLIEELNLDSPVVAAYDIGSRIAQTLVADRPDLVGALALSPPLPGLGRRILDPDVVPERWYVFFHRSPVSPLLIDGRPEAVRAYLEYLWTRWSGPNFTVNTPEFDELVARYSRPGAFTTSIQWYRAGAELMANSLSEQPPAPAERISTPTKVLWPEFDPVFRRDWADRLNQFFSDVTLHEADGVGHFTPLEAPQSFANLITEALAATCGA